MPDQPDHPDVTPQLRADLAEARRVAEQHRADFTPITIDAGEAAASEAAIRLVELQLRTSPLRELEEAAKTVARDQASKLMREAAKHYRARHQLALRPAYLEALERVATITREYDDRAQLGPVADAHSPFNATAQAAAIAAQKYELERTAELQRQAEQERQLRAALDQPQRGQRTRTVVTERRTVVSLDAAQTGDVRIGNVAGGNMTVIENLQVIIHQYFNGEAPANDGPDE